ncbi:hypothetical protein CAPTEDRAFT_211879 [Capitella teleta]|uniref:Uncharacterized protein n=1 Tax=Capitella teleta TaxID=283909 RepID=R7U0J0_CAPTE|nr:hypothetical protein CAPTEDRAFT_211879 [Capitella teleta]|eukprot:ELT99352.1 hypothetical protein CAPTEDRAFT_211879 [Capitella teleta]
MKISYITLSLKIKASINQFLSDNDIIHLSAKLNDDKYYINTENYMTLFNFQASTEKNARFSLTRALQTSPCRSLQVRLSDLYDKEEYDGFTLEKVIRKNELSPARLKGKASVHLMRPLDFVIFLLQRKESHAYPILKELLKCYSGEVDGNVKNTTKMPNDARFSQPKTVKLVKNRRINVIAKEANIDELKKGEFDIKAWDFLTGAFRAIHECYAPFMQRLARGSPVGDNCGHDPWLTEESFVAQISDGKN